MRILVTGTRAPVALHVAALLSSAGHEVTGADTFRSPLAHGAPWLAAEEVYPSPVDNPEPFAHWMQEAGQRFDMIFPTCEEVFWIAQLAPEAPLYAPEIDTLRRLHSKSEAMELLDLLAIGTPRTRRVAPGESAGDWPLAPGDTVLKPEFSRFGTKVSIAPATLDIPEPGIPWVLQERLTGTEVCATAIARDGVITGFSCYRPALRAGPGAGILLDPAPVRSRAGAALLSALIDLATVTDYTGILSADAIMNQAGVHIIEINPRATSGLHFFRDPDAFWDAVTGDAQTYPVDRKQVLSGAAWAFHPVRLIRDRAMRRAVRSAQEATAFGPHRPGTLRQAQTALALWRRARRSGAGCLEAATRDIAWDGAGKTQGEENGTHLRKM